MLVFFLSAENWIHYLGSFFFYHQANFITSPYWILSIHCLWTVTVLVLFLMTLELFYSGRTRGVSYRSISGSLRWTWTILGSVILDLLWVSLLLHAWVFLNHVRVWMYKNAECGLLCSIVCCEKKHHAGIWWCSEQDCRDWLEF